jgi:diguanylate cyclase (GGDEF)-like protein
MGRVVVDEERVRAACRERVLPLARGMAALTPVVGCLLLFVGRAAEAPVIVAWLAAVAALSVGAVLTTWRLPPDRPGGRDLTGWERRYTVFVVLCAGVWSTAPWVLRPPDGSEELQVLQVLLLTTVGNSLVLVGAFLPRPSRAAIGVLSLGTMVSLVVAGAGANRLLVPFVPMYAAISWWMQSHLHRAATQALRLAIVNEQLLERLAEDQRVLEHEATHDRLTGLLNRAAFLDLAAGRTAAAAPGEQVAVAYLDLDGFKGLNDRYGHAVGDAVLVAASARLRTAVRAGDVLARFGGDEFTVLFGAADAADAASLRLVDAFREPVEVDGRHVAVGLSVGVARADADHGDVDELLRRADRALYAAKANGRGRVEVDDGSPVHT